MKIYTRVIHKEPTSTGRIQAFAECGCETVDNTFHACQIHDALRDELAPVFLQRLMEEQERYDRGILRVTPEMVPDTDPTFEDFGK